jgi:hypothetical protein
LTLVNEGTWIRERGEGKTLSASVKKYRRERTEFVSLDSVFTVALYDPGKLWRRRRPLSYIFAVLPFP